MFDVLFIVDVLLIPFRPLSESEKITKFCSESIFSTISSVSPTASECGRYLSYLEFPANTIAYIYLCESYEWSVFISELSVAKHL
jgi:hypothetical protein